MRAYLCFSPNNLASFSAALKACETCLEKLSQWMVENKLRVNPNEKYFIIFGFLSVNACTLNCLLTFLDRILDFGLGILICLVRH